MKTLELLSPAKNLECGIAAINNGADAVYIGGPKFGARIAAGNSIDDIETLTNYAHQFGAKVYVTVNTMLRDDEIDEAIELLSELDRIQVDAILVQDVEVIKLAREITNIPLHASTQMDVRTPEKVAWLRSIGFKRVVLARELSLKDISAIHKAVPDVELEVFVHGALCVSYSGVCYASEYCFNRSANRGECAQFCRLAFNLVDDEGHILAKDKYLLSLKDMNRLNRLADLIKAGAVSFKIEGRLKDADYVKNVTAAYSQELNRIIKNQIGLRRASIGECQYGFTPNLDKTFNRGYTEYFLDGRADKVADFNTPKSKGEYVGDVKEVKGNHFTVAGLNAFANGDGLCFINTEGVLCGFRVNRAEGNKLFPFKMPSGLKSGERLYRNNDEAFQRLLASASTKRKIPVEMVLGETKTGFYLDVKDELGRKSHSTIEYPKEPARTSQIQNIRTQLTKLGNTNYVCSNLDIQLSGEWFIPSSMLSELRREAFDDISQCRLSNSKTILNSEQSIASLLPINSDNRHPLMQCRHCIRWSMGMCRKSHQYSMSDTQPSTLYLELPDRRRFRLEFDCKLCQMNIYAE